MKKSILFLMLFAMFVQVQSQTIEPKDPSKKKPSSDLENLRLANQLAHYGYKTFSATALIEAARIMGTIKTQDLKVDSFKQEGTSKDEYAKKSTEKYDMTSILAAAKKYADGDTKLLADIAGLEKANEAKRGRVGGPGEKYSTVWGNGVDTYQLSFIANELAEIVVVGDGDTDLDLYVFDSNMNIIARDIDYTDGCVVGWVPKWTGRYYVKIVNRGPISNLYHLITN